METFNRQLELWAPLAECVDVIANGERETLQHNPHRPGWWISIQSYGPGTHYGFIVDNKGPFPDPRSHSQPSGVHGLSCLVNHRAFVWTDNAWHPPKWSEAIVYELHIGTFSEEGTFEGAIQHLDSLVDLGVTHIELMPICEFPGDRGWGYDCVSIFSPHRAYGGVNRLKALINACHSKGLAVILDVVYNHMGPDANYVSKFGPYFSDNHMTPWGEGPNLDDTHCEEVRRFFIDNALMWLRDYHADGLRLDAIDKIKDDSEKHFLQELREAVDVLAAETRRPRLLIAESASNDPTYVRPVSEGGYGMDAQWNDDLHHSLRTIFTGESHNYYGDFGHIDQLVKALRQGFVYDGCYSKVRERHFGNSPAGLPRETFLAYLQTHDQVGNRAAGDRFHQHPKAGHVQQKIASAFVLLSPYIPMIFMGEEWAASSPFLYFTEHQDPVLAKAISEGRRKEFGTEWQEEVPDPQDEDTFTRSKLRWAERKERDHREMLDWYSDLLCLRKSAQELHSPDLSKTEVEADPAGKWLRMKRGPYQVIASLVDTPVVTNTVLTPKHKCLFENGSFQPNGKRILEFDGLGVVILYNERA